MNLLINLFAIFSYLGIPLAISKPFSFIFFNINSFLKIIDIDLNLFIVLLYSLDLNLVKLYYQGYIN